MNKKQILEFSLLTILLISGIGTVFKVPYCTWGVALGGFFLGILYFNLGFWLFAEFSISLINRIIAGLFYSVFTIACMFCFLKWPLWNLYSIISFIGLPVVAIICLFNNKKPDYKQLFYRTIFFIGVLSVVYCYRLFSI